MKVPAGSNCRQSIERLKRISGSKEKRYNMGVLYRKSSLFPTVSPFSSYFISLLIFSHIFILLTFPIFRSYFLTIVIAIFYQRSFVKISLLSLVFFSYFFITLALKSSDIFSIAYLRAGLSISFLFFKSDLKSSSQRSKISLLFSDLISLKYFFGLCRNPQK